jgi:hypothetical protein
VYGRIIQNEDRIIQECFNAVIEELRKTQPDLLAAKKALEPVKGLGAYSYSSKHLRMLCPQWYPVLDSLVDDCLMANDRHYAGIPIAQRFLKYAKDCRELAKQLTAARVSLGDYVGQGDLGELKQSDNPSQCAWTVADVDMAYFMWIKETRAFGGKSKPKPRVSNNMPSATRKVFFDIGDKGRKPVIFLVQNHEQDQALTIKENCDMKWNNAWICRQHGSLDFKGPNAKGTTRYLIGEILQLHGVDVTQHPEWQSSNRGKTCHQDGSGYQGRLRMGTVDDAVRYLKTFFTVHACKRNKDETQEWVDKL